MNLNDYTYSFAACPPVIVGLCILILGMCILIREKASQVSRAFAFLCLAGSIWLLSVAGIYSSRRPEIAFLWARIEHVGVAFIPTCLFFFTLQVTQRLARFRTLLWAGLAGSAGFASMALFSRAWIDGVMDFPWGYYPQFGVWGAPFLVFFSLYFLGSLLHLSTVAWQLPSGERRQQLIAFLRAFIIASLGTIDFSACYGKSIYPVGYLPIYTCLLMLAQSLWHYRFVDITPAFAVSQILETMPDALLVLDRAGLVQVANRAAEVLFHRAGTHLIGMPISALAPQSFATEQMEHLLKEGVLRDHEIKVSESAIGDSRTLSISVSLIRDAAHEVVAFVCAAKDITERKNVEEALHVSQRRFHRLMNSNIIGFMISDSEGHIHEINDELLRLLGYDRHELLGAVASQPRLSPPEYETLDSWIVQQLQTKAYCPPVERQFLRKDGRRLAAIFGAVTLEGSSGQFLCFIIDATERRAAQDALTKAYDELELRVQERTRELEEEIVKRQRAEEALRNQSLTDPLTGLYNRRGFMTLADQQLKLAHRKRAGFILYMADLDDLKPINDRYGHLEGDKALIEIGAILKNTFRESDIVARIGGDEFSVVALEDPSTSIADLLHRIQDRLDDHNRYSGVPYKLGLSVGAIRVHPEEGFSLQQLMARADTALYQQKRLKPAFKIRNPR